MQITPASPDNEAIRNIRDLAKIQSKQTDWIIYLTIVLAVVAVFQMILAAMQVGFLLAQFI